MAGACEAIIDMIILTQDPCGVRQQPVVATGPLLQAARRVDDKGVGKRLNIVLGMYGKNTDIKV